VVGLVGIGLLGSLLFTEWLPASVLWFPVVAFALLAFFHERIERRRLQADRAVAYYRHGLERLAGDWIGRGRDGARFADATHPYASDLDLFGRGSLFELLSEARTSDGEARLAAWLTTAGDFETLGKRQRAVDEFRGKLDLRFDLALFGDEIGSTVDTGVLLRWARLPAVLTRAWPKGLAVLFGLANLVTLTAWWAPLLQAMTKVARGAEELGSYGGALPFFLSLGASGLFAAWYGKETGRVLHAADRPQRELALLAGMLERLERERFDCEPLADLAATLRTGDLPSSRAIARLTRLVEIDESRHNVIFAALGGLVFAGTHLAHAMERWRTRHGAAVRGWVDAVARFEALSSLARHAFENPDDSFPELVEGQTLLEAEGVAHPLLPRETAVRNTVTLRRDGQRLWIVSGSNMAGKSTLLRTTGVNVVLALAGAPVRATRMRLGVLQLGVSMRLVDSLHEGTSHLYAELQRLKSILELSAGPRPVLFLLDEVLHGTNSSDRRVGAAAVISQLLERGAIGMVTTHDLALARIADDLGLAGANMHFVDHMENGELAFDYLLREGAVQKGNALELMRAIGLKV